MLLIAGGEIHHKACAKVEAVGKIIFSAKVEGHCIMIFLDKMLIERLKFGKLDIELFIGAPAVELSIKSKSQLFDRFVADTRRKDIGAGHSGRKIRVVERIELLTENSA